MTIGRCHLFMTQAVAKIIGNRAMPLSYGLLPMELLLDQIFTLPTGRTKAPRRKVALTSIEPTDYRLRCNSLSINLMTWTDYPIAILKESLLLFVQKRIAVIDRWYECLLDGPH